MVLQRSGDWKTVDPSVVYPQTVGLMARMYFLNLATRDTQFGQELALVMQTTHAQRMRSADSIPMCRLEFVFFHWKCTQVLQKSLSLSIKKKHEDTIMIYWDIWLHFQHLSGLFHPITKLRSLALILFISCSISIRTGSDQVDTFHAL